MALPGTKICQPRKLAIRCYICVGNPVDAAKSGDQMSAFNDDPIEHEITKVSVLGSALVACQEEFAKTRMVMPLGAAQQG